MTRGAALLRISWRFSSIAARTSGVISKPSRAANSHARIIRTGSSRNRISASPIVRTRRCSRSSTPPTQSMTANVAMS